MTDQRPYSAKEMIHAAEVLDASDIGDGKFDAMNAAMLRQAAQTEDKVMGLFEAIKAMRAHWGLPTLGDENDYDSGWFHARQSCAEEICEALSKFRGES